jgi:arginyl-tRNA synthetase
MEKIIDPIEIFRTSAKSAIATSLNKMGIETFDIKLVQPPEGMGDFAFECFTIAKRIHKSPVELAAQLVKLIPTTDLHEIKNIGPYINFYINPEKLCIITLSSILTRGVHYGSLVQKNIRITLEHTSANPTGPLHVGRARNPIIGDTLARILRRAGYIVKTQYYVNDMGKQSAILAWGVENIPHEDLPETSYAKADHELVGYYQVANKLMLENPQVASEIETLLARCERGEPDAVAKLKSVCERVQAGITQSLKALNIDIDEYIWESTFVEAGKVAGILDKLKQSKYCHDDKGAYYLDLAEFNIAPGRNHKFYLTRKDGSSLYGTRDIAFHVSKFQDSDIAIDILGEDHKLHIEQISVALKLIGETRKPEVIFYSFVRLPEGRMSTRTGRVVYLDELIDEAITRAYVEVKKRRSNELSESKMHEISNHVGIGAIRYNIIRVQPEKAMEFRWDDALNFEGNSAPFIQYAHARACSILRKAELEHNIEPWWKADRLATTTVNRLVLTGLTHQSEQILIRAIAELPSIIAHCAETRKPYPIASYAFNVASMFNQFYRDCPVLSAPSTELRTARLALVVAARFVLKNVLDTMGITALEEM